MKMIMHKNVSTDLNLKSSLQRTKFINGNLPHFIYGKLKGFFVITSGNDMIIMLISSNDWFSWHEERFTESVIL